MPLYKEDLPKTCQHPGCNCGKGPFFIHAKCHIRGKLEVYAEDGVLFVRCQECGQPVASFHIASKLTVN